MIQKHVVLLIFMIHISASISFAETIKRDSLKVWYFDPIKAVTNMPEKTIGNVYVKQIIRGEVASQLNLREIFTNVSGITNTFGTKDESNLRIRGFRKNEVKILVDGRPLNAGYFGNVDLNNMTLTNLKDVYIIKGPVSSMYGTGTMGGVINLITENPSNKKWFKLSSVFKRNNNNVVEFATAHSFDSWQYNLNYSLENSNGSVLSNTFVPTDFENGKVRNNAKKMVHTIQGSMRTEVSDFNEISLSSGITYIKRKEIPSSIYEAKYRLYKDWTRSNISIASKHNISALSSLSLMLYNDNAADDYLEYLDSHYTMLTIDSIIKNNSFGFNPRYEYEISPVAKITLGYYGEIYRSNRKDNKSYLTWTVHHLNVNQLFSQLETKLNASTKATLGIGCSKAFSDLDRDYPLITEPSIGVYYDINKQHSVFFSCGINSAYPTMHQLFSVDKGNPSLNPQKAVKTELNVQGLLNHSIVPLTYSMSCYYNNTQDLIDLYNGKFTNINAVNNYGCEASFGYLPCKWFSGDIAYTRTQYTKNSDYKLTETPTNQLTISHSILLPFKIKCAVNSLFTGNRLCQDDNNQYHNLQHYWLHNIQFNRKWDDYRIFFGMENILDANYQSEWGYPEAGINFNAGFEVSY